MFPRMPGIFESFTSVAGFGPELPGIGAACAQAGTMPAVSGENLCPAPYGRVCMGYTRRSAPGHPFLSSSSLMPGKAFILLGLFLRRIAGG
jgi:hypothetical protein